MNETCAAAVSTFGIRSQVDMMQEEMNELGVAINHWKRGRAKDEDVITEIADVMIMARQMAIIFGEEEVDAEVERKLSRLSDGINKKGKLKVNKEYYGC